MATWIEEFDPEQVLIDTIVDGDRLKEGMDPNTWKEVATDEDSGVTLWAGFGIGTGIGITWQATDGEGTSLVTYAVYEKARVSAAKSDGGNGGPEVPNCSYICAAVGDGGSVCWKTCTGGPGRLP
jgi:hypothetical protein